MNKSFHLASAIAFTALFSSCVKDTVKDKPNLLIIMTDEHSIRTLGCYRNYLADSQKNLWGESLRIETPNIDRLAAEGALCLNFYSSAPVSTPARASFQTGLYPASTGAPINGCQFRDFCRCTCRKRLFYYIRREMASGRCP